jgi:addiction module HigA family antidote
LLHPGEVLAEELESKGYFSKKFAELVDMRPSHFNELLKDKRHISAMLALKIEKHLGIDARFWMRLQVDMI